MGLSADEALTASSVLVTVAKVRKFLSYTAFCGCDKMPEVISLYTGSFASWPQSQ